MSTPKDKASYETDLKRLALGDPMSALGQKQTCAAQNGMSALPPKADMCGATSRYPLSANSGHRAWRSSSAGRDYIWVRRKTKHILAAGDPRPQIRPALQIEAAFRCEPRIGEQRNVGDSE